MQRIKKVYRQALMLIIFAFGTANLWADVIYSIPLEGKEHQIGNLLNWSTSNELNSQVFFVERSMDGIDYEIIGEVVAAGDSEDENGYRFLDVGVNNQKSYYRLRQVDVDGTFSHSQIILLKKVLPNNFIVMAMSNTVTNDRFTVSVDAVIDDEIYYAVKTTEGEVIYENKEELFHGLNEISVFLKDESEGTYYLVLKVKEEKEKLVIRKVNDEIQKKENVASRKQNNGG